MSTSPTHPNSIVHDSARLPLQPVDEELVLYFLKSQISTGRPTSNISDVDVYKYHPSHLYRPRLPL
jgi:hypothetical protein